MKRHIGKLANTDQRCVVVFMQIPGREDHALIVQTDNLQPRFEQAIMDIVDSQEAQAEATLANVLGRRMMPETGKTLLQTLHESGLLRSVHIDQVVMMPMPNMPFPLRKIIEGMGDNTLPPPSQEVVAEQEKFNAAAHNMAATTDEQRLGIAKNLLIEAEMLQTEAERKKAAAYKYAPELAPKAKAVAPAAKAAPVELDKVVKKAAPRKKAAKAIKTVGV